MGSPHFRILAGAAVALALHDVAVLVAFWGFLFGYLASVSPITKVLGVYGPPSALALGGVAIAWSRWRGATAVLAFVLAAGIARWEISAVRSMVRLHAVMNVVSDVCRLGGDIERSQVATMAGVGEAFRFGYRCLGENRFELWAPPYGVPVPLFPLAWRCDLDTRRFRLTD